jgi:hypothetical protein
MVAAFTWASGLTDMIEASVRKRVELAVAGSALGP